MKIAVTGEPPADLSLARRALQAAARPYRLPRGTAVTLAFVDDSAMRALNRRFRGHDRTTDVLSFGESWPDGTKGRAAAERLQAGPDGLVHLGDIVISGTQAARQARRRSWSLRAEVAFLAAHGVLHLLGFDDDTRAGYREMQGLGRAAVATARQQSVKR